MNRTVGLRPALQVSGIYTLIVGVLLLIPAWGSAVFAYTVKDAAAGSGWGSALLALGIVTLALAADVDRYGRLAWTVVVALLISAFDLLYFFIGGAYSARNAIVPIIINALLAAWVWSVRPKS